MSNSLLPVDSACQPWVFNGRWFLVQQETVEWICCRAAKAQQNQLFADEIVAVETQLVDTDGHVTQVVVRSLRCWSSAIGRHLWYMWCDNHRHLWLDLAVFCQWRSYLSQLLYSCCCLFSNILSWLHLFAINICGLPEVDHSALSNGQLSGFIGSLRSPRKSLNFVLSVCYEP